jgi:hypothetical protein
MRSREQAEALTARQAVAEYLKLRGFLAPLPSLTIFVQTYLQLRSRRQCVSYIGLAYRQEKYRCAPMRLERDPHQRPWSANLHITTLDMVIAVSFMSTTTVCSSPFC